MIQLVVPSATSGGVYDFATCLQRQLGEDRARLVHLSKSNAAAWKVEPGDDIVLQMSGYGFHKRGAPLWLLKEFRTRRKAARAFGIYFHEVYAVGPPWSSSFWLTPVQRHVARELANLSDFWMTNREDSANWLLRRASEKPYRVMPVFSSVGETGLTGAKRPTRAVIFGSPGLRQMTYTAGGTELLDWARREAIELHDVGRPLADDPQLKLLRAAGVVLHGELPGNQVSALMTKSTFGLLAYPVAAIAKSSVFAAYCAHGLCPLIFSTSHVSNDGLQAGANYVAGLTGHLTSAEADRIAAAAWNWYQPHDLRRTADATRDLLNMFAGSGNIVPEHGAGA